ncbi:hypothetical protein FDE29_13760 [Vibrio parahaemolyticus]|uniref:hypothetical protein n=1 Tax=Vibrio harveyi group TaxID=717610 RepID=UPI000697F0CE|nr:MULTISPECIES: hypothetical protein [Vibrio harveyi group]EGQ8456663.1 hypothetical protein [Vibrio parahaemolyticus]EGQ8460321.1 hypothetical protein [Vibrio parahaemolyticus]EGQ9242161.1 hypothetical protein [Vibrio parahaemolyticus]EGQ9405094.1 hypothetical protein [Vibrio parahaemolyticus]EGR0278528.1 hypothetical protein [Vibrio parahaemolyticus]
MDITTDLICTYLSQRNVLSVQQMVNAKLIVNSEDEPTHVQGWCSITSSPRTLRVDHILDIHDSIGEAEIFFKEAKAKLEQSGFEFDVPQPNRLSSPSTMDVCFTGFTKGDKSELTNLAQSKEMMVRQSVTRHLDILCYGFNAGPKKLEKALEQGVMILNRHQFENLLETGEVPEDI